MKRIDSGPRGVSKYEVRKADLDIDRDAILRLWLHKETGSDLTAAKLDWYYKSNPVGIGHIFLLYCDTTAQPVGVIGAAQRLFVDRGDELRASVIIDLVIEPEHRTIGPGLLLQRTANAYMRASSDFVFSFPNRRSTVLRKKLGFDAHRELGHFVCPIDIGTYLPTWIPKWFGSPISVFYGMLVGLRWRALVRSEIHATEMNENFTENLCFGVRSSGLVSGDRGFPLLEWRLANRPDKDVEFFCMVENDGRSVGYVAYAVSPDNKVNIADFYCSPNYSASLLLAPFLRHMKSLGRISVALEIDSLCKGDIRALRSIGFFRREVSDVYVSFRNENIAQNIRDRLRISRYDGDS